MALGSGILTNAQIYVNSLKLAKMSNVQVQRSSNIQKGYSQDGEVSFTVGVPETDITVTSLVPSEDFEMDPAAFMFKGKRVTLTIVAGGRSGSCDGVIMTDSFDSAVNSNASHSFTFSGGKLTWD